MTGLCVVLKSLTHPCHFRDMIPTFGLSVPELCMLLTLLSTTLTRNIAIWNDALLSPANLQRYAESIAAKGAPLGNCFGFVDGTPMCRPKENQRAVCNGHKRVHSLKFQLVALPNGMVASLYDPIGELFSNVKH